jgi:hypothetical protein
MPIASTALMNLVVVALIGIVVGLLFSRYGRGWLSRQFAGGQSSDLTWALVGIAGAFLGFHVGVVLGLVPLPIAQYLTAIVGAAATLWLWRGR